MKNTAKKFKIKVQRFGNTIITQYFENKIIVKTEVKYL
jgi:hypothetical protein